MRLLIFLLITVSAVFCGNVLPKPTNNFVATLSQAQAWDLAPSMFTIYSAQGIGYRWDFPILGQNIFFDIKNKIYVVMNQTDFTCVTSSWPQAADHWAFITPSNSTLVTTGQMPTGQNFTFWQFTIGLVSPNEAWAFAGDIPLSGTALGIESWTFKTFVEQKIPLNWLKPPCQKTSYSNSNDVPKPMLRTVRL